MGTNAIRHADFARRLNAACDRAGVPPLNRGRLKWLSDRLPISMESARRWIAGETQPRGPSLQKLAEALGVEPGWLYAGTSRALRDDPAVFDHAEAPAPPEDRGERILERIRQRLGGTVTVMPGVDLTEPTGELWDADRD